jgi:hypothetical protein
MKIVHRCLVQASMAEVALAEALEITLTNGREAPPVCDQPDVELQTWRVVEDQWGTRRVLGILGQNTIRVTTPIQSLNPVSRLAVTHSGRRYHFHQAPVTERAVVAAMLLHAFDHHVVVTRDVSDQLWALMQESIQ